MPLTLTDMLDAATNHVYETHLGPDPQKQVEPFYHLISGSGENVIVPCCFPNDQSKDLTVGMVKLIAEDCRATAVMFVTEAWVIDLSPEDYNDGNHPRPSEHPNRIEVVIIAGTDGFTRVERIIDLVRGPDGRVTELLLRSEGAGEPGHNRMLDGILDPSPTRH